jgi:hypothetical protein
VFNGGIPVTLIAGVAQRPRSGRFELTGLTVPGIAAKFPVAPIGARRSNAMTNDRDFHLTASDARGFYYFGSFACHSFTCRYAYRACR